VYIILQGHEGKVQDYMFWM